MSNTLYYRFKQQGERYTLKSDKAFFRYTKVLAYLRQREERLAMSNLPNRPFLAKLNDNSTQRISLGDVNAYLSVIESGLKIDSVRVYHLIIK
jgi:hypothetical protein